MVPKHLVRITAAVLVQQPSTLIASMQHICSHRPHKLIKKTFLGAPLRCLWTPLLRSFLSCTHHTLSWSVHRKLSAHITTSPTHYIIHISGTSCQCCPGVPHLRLAKKQKESKLLFQGGTIVSFFWSAIFFPLTSAPLTCHPQLQAGTKCTVYYTYTHRQCLCTHKPFLLSFLSLSADCIRKCSQAWNGSFDAFSSDVPCMKQSLARAHE